jgi:AraC-like DNA-binding protein
MTLTDILFVLVIFQLLFLSLFLFTQQKGKQLSNRLLGFFFLAISLNLLDVFLLRSGIYTSYPGLAGMGNCLPLLFGPLLYFYTQTVIYKNFSVGLKTLPHFLPFLVFFAGTETYYLIQPQSEKETILRSILEHHIPLAVTIVSTLIFIQFLIYAVYSLGLVSRYKKAANQLFSDPVHTDVSWLNSTIVFFILIVIVSTLNNLLAQIFLAKYYLLAFNLVVLALFFFVINVILKALRGSHVFSFTEQHDLSDRAGLTSKAPRVIADKGEKEQIIQLLARFMESDKPYLEPELSLEQLALKLSLKPRPLSQAINEILGQNFFDYINRYRIDEAKRLLTNPKDEKITVLEVLYEVGFNSKSSFNTLFKKYTGLTPTEFRKNQVP